MATSPQQLLHLLNFTTRLAYKVHIWQPFSKFSADIKRKSHEQNRKQVGKSQRMDGPVESVGRTLTDTGGGDTKLSCETHNEMPLSDVPAHFCKQCWQVAQCHSLLSTGIARLVFRFKRDN